MLEMREVTALGEFHEVHARSQLDKFEEIRVLLSL